MHKIYGKTLLDIEQLRQLASEKQVYIFAEWQGCKNVFTVDFYPIDHLGYKNVFHIVQEFMNYPEVSKCTPSELHERVPYLSGAIREGKAYQVQVTDLRTHLYHTDTLLVPTA